MADLLRTAVDGATTVRDIRKMQMLFGAEMTSAHGDIQRRVQLLQHQAQLTERKQHEIGRQAAGAEKIRDDLARKAQDLEERERSIGLQEMQLVGSRRGAQRMSTQVERQMEGILRMEETIENKKKEAARKQALGEEQLQVAVAGELQVQTMEQSIDFRFQRAAQTDQEASRRERALVKREVEVESRAASVNSRLSDVTMREMQRESAKHSALIEIAVRERQAAAEADWLRSEGRH